MKRTKTARGMTVKAKMLLFSTIMFVIIIFTAVTGLWEISMTNQAHEKRYDNYGRGELELSGAFSNFHQVKVHLRNLLYLYADDSEKQQAEITKIHEVIQQAEDNLAAYSARLNQYDSKIAADYEQCMGYIQEYKDSVQSAISYVESGQLENARQELLTTGVASANNAEDVMNTIIAQMEEGSAIESAKIKKEIEVLRLAMIIICAVSVFLGIVFCFRLIKSITVPVARLTKASKKLAVGDVEVDCQKLYNDDLGELMDRFSEMADTIKEQAKIAERISQGDMTVSVSPQGERDVLGMALQKLVEDNNYMLGNIKESTTQVSTGAQEVAAASQALAEGSTEQASAIEQVTASIDEIAASTRENADKARQADCLVQNVKEEAVLGNEQMKDMISAMNEINESSETISKIIKVIDDIAFQTNILALNATVEAARAGEHGKGFAVVADEVRNLASRSSSSASETAEMIEDSITKIHHGTMAAEKMAAALEEIVNSINQVVDLMGDIAVTSESQSTAITQIDQAIDQVSQVVQTNSATSEECAAASEELSSQAAKLKSLMAGYKLVSDTMRDEDIY